MKAAPDTGEARDIETSIKVSHIEPHIEGNIERHIERIIEPHIEGRESWLAPLSCRLHLGAPRESSRRKRECNLLNRRCCRNIYLDIFVLGIFAKIYLLSPYLLRYVRRA